MTTLTKIFVVLVCLFAFIFTPLAISFAARTHDWKAAAESLMENIESAKARERSTLATAAAAIAHQKDLLSQERDRVANLQGQITGLETNVQTLKLRLEEAESKRDNWENSAQTLSAELKVINAHIQALIEENQRLTRSELDLQTRNTRLREWVAEQDAKVVILSKQLARLQEELSQCRVENEELRKGGMLGGIPRPGIESPTPGAEGVRPAVSGPIQAQVVSVNRNRGLASIDVGSSAGVVPGMVMVVTRGEHYICDLVITEDIAATEAVGTVRSEGAQQIRAGDLATDLRSFNQQ